MKTTIVVLLLSAAATLAAQQPPPADLHRKVPVERPDPQVEKPPYVNETGKPWTSPTPAVRAASELPARKERPPRDPARAAPLVPGAGLDLERVHFDEPGDGDLWAAGATYKARFAPDSFTYVPFLGSDAPRNFPLQLRIASVRVGGRLVRCASRAAPVRHGNRVVFDRGGVVETYDLSPRAVEQTFTVIDSAGVGDVVVALQVESELCDDEGRSGLRFDTSLGGVAYGTAFVVHGSRKQEIRTRHARGRIELVVDATQRDGSAAVTIDPILSTWSVANPTPYACFEPDVAYDVTHDRYMVCYERAFSATDHDVVAELRTTLGAAIGGSADFIDVTTAFWSKPRIAGNNLYDRCLVVCEELGGSSSTIRGRVRNMVLPVVQSGQFTVSGSEPGSKTDPDVGGDPGLTSPTYWFVVYRRVFSVTDTDVHGRRVGWDPTLGVPVLDQSTVLIDDSSNTIDFRPAISKSNGLVHWTQQDWLVVFSRQFSATDADVRGAAVHWDGTIRTPAFGVDSTVHDDRFPAVSSPTDVDPATMSYLIVYQRAGADEDVYGQVRRKTNALQVGVTDLSALTGATAGHQERPVVDSDGTRFLLVYWEGTPGYATPLHIAGTTLRASDARTDLNAGNFVHPRVCADRSGGGAAPWYSVVNTDLSASPDAIHGTVFGGHGAGGFTTVRPGCGGLGMNTAGRPWLGETVTFTLSGVGGDVRALVLGLPGLALPLCPNCWFGVDLTGPNVVLPNTSTSSFQIPREGSYVGVTLSVQGIAFGTGPCTAFGNLRVGPQIDFRIQ